MAPRLIAVWSDSMNWGIDIVTWLLLVSLMIWWLLRWRRSRRS